MAEFDPSLKICAKLRELIAFKVKVVQTAKKLKRSPGAIYARINSLKKLPCDLPFSAQRRLLRSERLAAYALSAAPVNRAAVRPLMKAPKALSLLAEPGVWKRPSDEPITSAPRSPASSRCRTGTCSSYPELVRGGQIQIG